MVIVSSIIKSNIHQRDGRLSITEVHVSSAGEEVHRSYKAPSGSDMDMLLAQHAIDISNALQDSEAQNLVSQASSGVNIINIAPKYITKRRALRTLLKAFLISNSDDGRKMLITLNSLTDNQINQDYSFKLTKIKRRRANLNLIKNIVDVDSEDIE